MPAKPILLSTLLALVRAMPGFAALPSVDLTPTLRSGAVRAVDDGSFRIEGTVTSADAVRVLVRVGTSTALSHEHSVPVTDGRFACRYPEDFPAAPPLSPMVCYIDATDAAAFAGSDPRRQAEITLFVSGGPRALPDLPLVYTDDFIDAQGRTDQACAQWPRQRFLANRFLRSRGARLMGIGKPDFDLDREPDFAWFKERISIYDFDHRDRDWSQPLQNRVARGFWQASPDRWFNPSNSHPWDGNADNRDPANYRPYTFTNDAADLLVLYRMMQGIDPAAPDQRRALADEVQANLLALQHTASDNFALAEADGRREHYTAGAFRYGMFETGEWLTEGKGWFANPKFRDFAWGGVFNGRSIWAIGEALRAESSEAAREPLRAALVRALRFCLRDGLEHGYTRKTPSGLPVWNRTAGEHGYLLLGLTAACRMEPTLPVALDPAGPARALADITVDALDALVESAAPDGTWTRYANATAVNIAALAEGVRVLPDHAHADRWRQAVAKASDHWLALESQQGSAAEPTPMFGHMIEDGRLTFVLGKGEHPHVSLYIGGHWLHALAVAHEVTRNPRLAARAHAILAYYCGANPLRVRLLNEIGAVNNRLTDTDHDGVFDRIGWDAYPESTAFVQIGLLELLRTAGK